MEWLGGDRERSGQRGRRLEETAARDVFVTRSFLNLSRRCSSRWDVRRGGGSGRDKGKRTKVDAVRDLVGGLQGGKGELPGQVIVEW